MTPDGQREYFILVCTDAETVAGYMVPALEVAKARIKKRAWPLYDGTKNRRRLGPGDLCLVYVGGHAEAKQSIIARGEVASVSAFAGNEALADDPSLLVDSPRFLLQFREIRELDQPVPFAELLAQLSFVPRNLAKWGSVMQGGSRRISREDFDLLVSSRGPGTRT